MNQSIIFGSVFHQSIIFGSVFRFEIQTLEYLAGAAGLHTHSQFMSDDSGSFF